MLKEADKANGYVFGDKERDTLESLMSTAMGADFQYMKYPSFNFTTHVDVSFRLVILLNF